MEIYTTNYKDAFLQIAYDCTAKKGEMPPNKKSGKTIANLQYEILNQNPYQYTSDDVLFECYKIKNSICELELKSARKQFFSKRQACFRASPLTKRYGWGIHYNNEGKMAIYGCETTEYKMYSECTALKVIKAMKSTNSIYHTKLSINFRE